MTFSNQTYAGKPPPNKPAVRNPYVKSTSIHSSFQSISAETDKYRQATQQAHAERQVLLQRLQSGKMRTQDLADSLRAAQDKLGGTQRETNLLEREEKSLREEMIKERQVLEELTVDIQAREASEKRERQDFCSKMSELNGELGTMLYEQEMQRLAWLIHPETPLEVFVTSQDENMGDGTHEAEKETGKTDKEVTKTNNVDGDESHHSLLRAALESLKRTAMEFETNRAQTESYEAQILDARQSVLENQSAPQETVDPMGNKNTMVREYAIFVICCFSTMKCIDYGYFLHSHIIYIQCVCFLSLPYRMAFFGPRNV